MAADDVTILGMARRLLNPSARNHEKMARVYLKAATKWLDRLKVARRNKAMDEVSALHALYLAALAAENAQFAGDTRLLAEAVVAARHAQTKALGLMGVPASRPQPPIETYHDTPRDFRAIESWYLGNPRKKRGKKKAKKKRLNIDKEADVVTLVKTIQAGLGPATITTRTGATKTVHVPTSEAARAAASRLYEAYYGRLYKSALRLVKAGRKITTGGDRADAHDVMQAAFLKILQTIGKFEFRKPEPGKDLQGDHIQFYVWMNRIVANEAMDWSRQMGKAATKKAADKLIKQLDARQIPEEFKEPLAYTVTAERVAQVIRESLDRLPKEQRKIIILADMEGLSTREIGERTGTPPMTVVEQLSRSRKALQKLLHQRLAPKKVETVEEVEALTEEEAEDVAITLKRKLEAAHEKIASMESAEAKKKRRGNPSPRRRPRSNAMRRLMRL